MRKVCFWFKRTEWLKQILAFLFVLLISVLSAKFTTDYFFQHLTQQQIDNASWGGFLTTIGAMIGGMLAIVFSLSIFATQNASDLFSSYFFQEYAHNTAEKIRYFFISLITLIFFASGFFFYGNPVSIDIFKNSYLYFFLFNSLTIDLIGLVFIIIYWQYKNVLKKLSPTEALYFLEGESIKFLKKVHKDAISIANILKAKDENVSKDFAIAAAYNNYLQLHLNELNAQIGKLIEISLRFAQKEEIEASKIGFLGACDIIVNYLLLRKDSSLAFISTVSFMAFESDSERFLVSNLERFNKAGENFIKNHKIENALQIVKIYGSLLDACKEIKFSKSHYENPIFNLVRGYLKSYQDYAIRENELDVIFEITKLQHKLASIVVHNNLHAGASMVQDALLELAYYGIKDKKVFIANECLKVFLNMLRFIFSTKYVMPEVLIRQILNSIQSLTVTLQLVIESGYIPNEFSNSTTATKGYDDMIILLSEVMVLYGKQEKPEDKDYTQGVFVELVEGIYESLRKLTRELKKCDTILTNSIGRLISEANSLIIFSLKETDFKSYHNDLENTLIGFISLPSWFVYESKSIDNNFNFATLIDGSAKAALMILDKGLSNNLVIKCINSIFSSLKQAFAKIKTGYGNDEPRIMLKICYIGVLALKLDKQKILTEVGVAIYEFEELYIKKYFSQPDELRDRSMDREKLFNEYFRWRDDFIHEKYNGRSLMNDSETLVANYIDEDDIDRFMFEIWGSFPSHSPIQAEIEKKLQLEARKIKYFKLIQILKIILKKKGS